MDDKVSMPDLARRVRVALEAADVEAFRQLLDPDVRWGPPDAAHPPCRNRDQVLAWYERGRAAGTRARVIEVVVEGDKLVVGLAVSANAAGEGAGGDVARWQVLTVKGGRVSDIVGFETRVEALARAGGGAA